MDFEVKQKTKITVGIYGSEYQLRKPTVSEVELISQFVADKDSKDQHKYIVELMEKLGLPKQVSMDMEIDQFSDLVTFLMSKLKKN